MTHMIHIVEFPKDLKTGQQSIVPLTSEMAALDLLKRIKKIQDGRYKPLVAE